MADCKKVVALFIIFSSCCALSAGNSQAGGCTADDEQLLQAISEDFSSEGVSYVQKKASMVQEHEHAPAWDPPVAANAEDCTWAECTGANSCRDNEACFGQYGDWLNKKEPGSNKNWEVCGIGGARCYCCPPVAFDAKEAPNLDKVHMWAEPLKWKYEPTTYEDFKEPWGPNMWSMVEGGEACAEQGTQSPVDVGTSAAIEHPHLKPADLQLKTTGDCPAPTYILNERTVELMYKPDDCELALKAVWVGTDYKLIKINFRSPSEHTWDGGYFPMEAHLVHRTHPGGPILIIAVMVRVAYEASGVDPGVAAFMLDVLGKTPKARDEDKTHNNLAVERQTSAWNVYTDFVPDLSAGFYHYTGSLTTPPCTPETVWILPEKPVTIPSVILKSYRELINGVSITQLSPFGTIVGDDDTNALPPWHPESHMTEWSYLLKCNNRPIQPLTGANDPTRAIYKIVA